MGGIGSGRQNGGPTTDRAVKLDIRHCFATGMFQRGARIGGVMEWAGSSGRTPGVVMRYDADLRDPTAGSVRFWYGIISDDGTRQDIDYRVSLVATPQPFGGRRWWLVCPKSGARAVVLYLAQDGTTFGSRRALGLAYRSQRETVLDRLMRRTRTVDARLGGDGNLAASGLPKPRWMRWPTFHRLAQQRAELRSAVLAEMARGVDASIAAHRQLGSTPHRILVQSMGRAALG